jgi:hypothetical protein
MRVEERDRDVASAEPRVQISGEDFSSSQLLEALG